MTVTHRAGTTIYLVHHGNTRLDEEDRTHGNNDEGLTERGRREIRKTAAFLEQKGVGELYSSPAKRAVETAELIRKHLRIEKPNTERDGLLPMDIGTLGGMKNDEVSGVLDDLVSRLWARAPGGESVGKFLGRWQQELDRTIHEALEEDHACVYVTHSHNLGTLPYCLSSGVAPIALKSGVGPGGVIALHVADHGGQVVIDEQFDMKPSTIEKWEGHHDESGEG